MFTIQKEQLKKIFINEETGELTIEFCNNVDRTAISKVVLKVEIKEVKHAESFTYL
jgi:flagellar basal body P-ring protein FlgI